MDAKFFKKPMHVSVYRCCRDPERRSDFLVLHALEEAGQQLLFAGRQTAFLGYLTDVVDELNQKWNDLLCQCELAFENIINGIQEFLRGDRLDLKPFRTRHQRPEESWTVRITGEYDNRVSPCSQFLTCQADGCP